MTDDNIFSAANRAILEARRLIEKADAALRQAQEFQRELGFSKQSIDEYLGSNLTESQRKEVDALVKKTLQEMHDESERAIYEQKRNFVNQRPHKFKVHI